MDLVNQLLASVDFYATSESSDPPVHAEVSTAVNTQEIVDARDRKLEAARESRRVKRQQANRSQQVAALAS